MARVGRQADLWNAGPGNYNRIKIILQYALSGIALLNYFADNTKENWLSEIILLTIDFG